MHSRSEYRQHAVFCILSSSSLNKRVNCPCHRSPTSIPTPYSALWVSNTSQLEGVLDSWQAHSRGISCLFDATPAHWRQSRQVVAQPPRSSTLATSGVGTERAQQGAGPTSIHLVSCLQTMGMQHGNVQMMIHERLMTEGEAIKKKWN